MIKLSDFARQQGVTPRAVQKLLQKYEAEIEGHFERKGQNGTWFDDYAQEFLRSKMLQKPVVVYDETASPLLTENKELRDKLDKIRDELNETYKALVSEQSKFSDLQIQLAERTTEQKFLETSKEQAEKQAIELRKKNVELEVALFKAEEENKTLSDVVEINAQESERAKAEAAELRSELDRLKNRGFFARLFNREG